MSFPRVAVIGCGYWGKNHVRNFRELGSLAAICDLTEEGRTLARKLAPDVPIFDSTDALFAAQAVDGVVVATPAETHFAVTRQALEAGYDVLVEKPLALRVDDGRHLVNLAKRRQRILMVGHVLEYHPAILRLQELIRKGTLGAVHYIYSNRLNLGKIRREENILWSFAPHDIAIILRLVGDMPYEVLAAGGAYIQANVADVTVTQMLFDNGVRAHIFVSWMHPYKEQRLIVVGSKKMAMFDDVSKELRLFDQRVEWEDGHPLPINNGSETIEFSAAEPLRLQCQAFLDSIKTRKPPLTDGDSALSVLETLSAAQRSLMTQGQPVHLPMRGIFDEMNVLLPLEATINVND